MSKKDNDNIPNRGRSTSVTSETNSYVDHSIAASTFGAPPVEHDDVAAVARSQLLVNVKHKSKD